MKISDGQIREIIKEELDRALSEASWAGKALNVQTRLGQAYEGGKLVKTGIIDDIFQGALSMGADEVKDRSFSAVTGFTALESGLVGLAIGVPMMFFEEYKESQKGDNMARYMAKILKRPVGMKDLLDPRDPKNRKKIVAQGGKLKSNPILYLANGENTNTAAQLYKDKVIASDVYKTIMGLWKKKNQAVEMIRDVKANS